MTPMMQVDGRQGHGPRGADSSGSTLGRALRLPIGIAVSVIVAALLLGAAVEGFPLSKQPARVAMAAAASPVAPVLPATPPSPPPSVRFVNPFDATEVFEFPPGTTEAAAHDAVASLLIKRAQERQQARRERLAALRRHAPRHGNVGPDALSPGGA
jgi:hypothetical protein